MIFRISDVHPQKLRTAALEIREMKTVCPLRPGLSSEGHAEAGVGKEKGASVLVRSTELWNRLLR